MNFKIPFLIGALGSALLVQLPVSAQESPPGALQPVPREFEQPVNQNPADPEPLKSGVKVEGLGADSVKIDFEARNIPNVVGWWEVTGSEEPSSHRRDFRRIVRANDDSGDFFLYGVKSTEPRYPPSRTYSVTLGREPLIRLKWDSIKKYFSGTNVIRSDWPVPFRSEVDFKLFPSTVQEQLTTEMNLNDQATKKIEEIQEVVKLHRELTDADARLWAIVRNLKPKEEWKRVAAPNYAQIGDHLVVETADELKVINTKTGVPSVTRIEAPSNGETRLERLAGQGNFIFGVINGKILAYSVSSQKWGTWTHDQRTRFNIGVGPDLMSVIVDGRAIAFFTANGVWVSAETIAKSSQTKKAASPYPDDEDGTNGKRQGLALPQAQIPVVTNPASLPQGFFPSSTPAMALQELQTQVGVSGKQSWRLQGKGVLIAQTDDGIAGFSEIRGKWDRIVVPPRRDGKPYFANTSVGENMAVVIVNNELFAFGNAHGKWVRATIPEQLKEEPVPTVGIGVAAVKMPDSIYGVYDNSSKWGRLAIPGEYRGKAKSAVGVHTLHAEIGNKLYILSATTGEWTSPDETGTDMVDVVPEGPSAAEQSASISKETKFFSAQIGQLEADSLRAAAKVNELTKQHGADHESVKSARAELDKVLNDALDVRFLREEFRVKELRTRLGRLEQQIGQRKAQRATIIERRADELLNGGAFKWDAAAAVRTGVPSSSSLAVTESPKGSPDSDGFRGEREQKSDPPAMERSEKELSAEVIVGLEMSIGEFSKQVEDHKQKIAMQRDQVASLEEAQKKAPKDELVKASLERSKATLDRMDRTMNIYEEQYKVARNDAELKIQKVRLENQEMEDSLLIKGGMIDTERVKANALRLVELKSD